MAGEPSEADKQKQETERPPVFYDWSFGLSLDAYHQEAGNAPEVIDVVYLDAFGAVVFKHDGVAAFGVIGEEFDALAVGGY